MMGASDSIFFRSCVRENVGKTEVSGQRSEVRQIQRPAG